MAFHSVNSYVPHKSKFNEFVPFFNENFLKIKKNFHFFCFAFVDKTEVKMKEEAKGEDVKKFVSACFY